MSYNLSQRKMQSLVMEIVPWRRSDMVRILIRTPTRASVSASGKARRVAISLQHVAYVL
jgi:hypothetical protein